MGEAAGKDLYERDFYAWTQDQAARLRALGGDSHFDVEHMAEEIEDLGKKDRRVFESFLVSGCQHLVQAATSLADEANRKWLREVRNFLAQARRLRRDSPTLVNKINMTEIWSEAVREANGNLRIYADPEFPTDVASPFTLDSLLDETFDPEDGVEALTGGAFNGPGSGGASDRERLAGAYREGRPTMGRADNGDA